MSNIYIYIYIHTYIYIYRERERCITNSKKNRNDIEREKCITNSKENRNDNDDSSSGGPGKAPRPPAVPQKGDERPAARPPRMYMHVSCYVML